MGIVIPISILHIPDPILPRSVKLYGLIRLQLFYLENKQISILQNIGNKTINGEEHKDLNSRNNSITRNILIAERIGKKEIVQ